MSNDKPAPAPAPGGPPAIERVKPLACGCFEKDYSMDCPEHGGTHGVTVLHPKQPPAPAPSERCAKKRDDRKWRIGFDDHRGERVHEEGDNRKKSVFDEIVLGDWLHIEMMNEKDDCYWMRLGVGKDERVFFSYVKNGKRVIRQDEGPGHE